MCHAFFNEHVFVEISHQSYEIGAVIIPTLQLGKLRLPELKGMASGCAIGKWQSRFSNSAVRVLFLAQVTLLAVPRGQKPTGSREPRAQ